MSESTEDPPLPTPSPPPLSVVPSSAVTVDEVSAWLARLGIPAAEGGTAADISDAARIDQIELLERLKSAAAARQAELTAAFAASQRAAQQAAGGPARKLGVGIGAQVGLARHDSSNKGSQHVGLAHALTEMPHTLAALRRGDTSEWRATVMARETACLSREDRQAVDAVVGPQLADYGDRRTEREARAEAYRRDPGALVHRLGHAAAERRVSLRPAPDSMTYLTGLLPVKDGVAANTALQRYAEHCRAAGDQRSEGQIMADELVARITGTSTADGPNAEIVVVVNGATLFAGPTTQNADASNASAGTSDVGADASPAGTAEPSTKPVSTDVADEPGFIPGYGPVPGWWIRELARNSQARVWVRRAFAHPKTGRLIGLESRRRLFPAGLRKALIVRDRTCRTPWCDAPIRHADHLTPHADGGTTSLANGDGLCAACNYAKQAPGYSTRAPDGDAGGVIEITTPTGHTYHSKPPPLPGYQQASTNERGDLPKAS